MVANGHCIARAPKVANVGVSWNNRVIKWRRGRGIGKPGFPIPLRTGYALAFPGAGVWGNLVPPWSR